MRAVPVLIGLLMWSSFPPARGSAQDRKLTGTWSVTSAAASGETKNGGTWSRTAISGRLDIEQAGSTIKGRWQGPKGDPWRLTGSAQDRKFELRSESREIAAIVDGIQTTVPMHWTFRGTVDGDKITGTVDLSRDDDAESERMHPFTAVRKG